MSTSRSLDVDKMYQALRSRSDLIYCVEGRGPGTEVILTLIGREPAWMAEAIAQFVCNKGKIKHYSIA